MDSAQTLSLAERILRASASDSEGDVRQTIGNLLDAMGVETRIEYPTPAGPADIYCPNRRIVVEVKALGGAHDPHKIRATEGGETPKQQVERYLRAETGKELSQFPFLGDQPWIGVVTDGRVWHAWRYPHQRGAVGQEVIRDWHPRTPSALVEWLQSALLDAGLVGKPIIPSNPISEFKPYLESLQALFDAQPEPKAQERETKRLLWLDMLRTSCMAPSRAAETRLFVTHSFLVAVARGAIATLMAPSALTVNGPGALREGFVAWIVDSHAGREWAQRLFHRIHQFEWRQREGDVLRPLYEDLVQERDRKIFGEFYTPDWLAELMVREVLDEEWCERSVQAALSAIRTGAELTDIGVLDPTCGSATFLYHAARRILASPASEELPPAKQAAAVSMLVNGIDVHPVAAELARATLLRALPAPPPDGEASLRIYQGDALLARPGSEYTLLGSREDCILIITPQHHEVELPQSFVVSPGFAADLRRMIDRAREPRSGSLPKDILESIPESDRMELRRCFTAFREIVRLEGNSIWAWYIINITGPTLLANRKVDRIVANPPWVRMADIQVPERKRVLEQFAQDELRIWTGGKQSPHFDIASLFIRRVRERYLANPQKDVGAWLVKKAALQGGNWKKFRVWHARFLRQQLDLEKLQPFGGGDARRSCVLIENRGFRRLTSERSSRLVANVVGRRPFPHQRLDEVEDSLLVTEHEGTVAQGRSAYVDERGRALFRQGATITPKVLVCVAGVSDAPGPGRVRVTTDRSWHLPWSGVSPRTGTVPRHWVMGLSLSKQLLPFAMLRPSQALIPVDSSGDLLEDPGAACSFWTELDEIYREFRGRGRSTPKTLLDRLNFNGTLASQLPLRSHLQARTVVYPKSGDIMRASRSHGGKVVDFTLYRWVAESEEEAAFLVTLLNSAYLRVAFKQSRRSGRDFHLHPWLKVPLVRFDGANCDHRELASLARRAEAVAADFLRDHSQGMGQVGLSKRIRGELADGGLMGEIDRLVAAIMPDGVARTP